MTGITFEIRVQGYVDPESIAHLSELTMSQASASTVLAGEVVDQAALVGLLTQLGAQGLLVLEVRRGDVIERASGEGDGSTTGGAP